jgi:hypothetical protein
MSIDKIDVRVVDRTAPSRGPTSSADYNASLQEIINSLSQISISWNETLQPLIDTLPSGTTGIIREERTGSPNPFLNGFDGSQVFTDLTSTPVTDEGRYYSESLSRPLTIKESLENVQDELQQSVQDLLVRLAQVEEGAGVTARQRQAIGARVFDPESASTPGSLDGLTQSLSRNVDQIALDLAGELAYLNNNGARSLTHTVFDQIDAIQEEHNYNPVTNEIDHSHLPLHIHRYSIEPVGAIDGVNKEYEIPGGEKFIKNSLRVMVNGLEVQKTKFYTERADRRGFTFTFNHPALENDGAQADDYIWVHYDIDPNEA